MVNWCMKMPSQGRAQGLPNNFLEGSSNWQEILVHGGAYQQPLELNNYSTMFHDPNAEIQARFLPSTSSGYGNGGLIDESFAQPLSLDDGSWEQLLSLMEAPSSSPDNVLVNKSFRAPPMSSPYVAQKSNLMQSIMKSPPESNWNRVQHKSMNSYSQDSSYQIMPPPMDQSHYTSIHRHQNNLPYMNTDGFPVCYDSHYNMNNTRADTSSVITSSSQFAPLTPQPFKRSHQYSAEMNHSLDQSLSQYKTTQQDNLMASSITYSSHFAPATPQPAKPVEVYQSPATQKQDRFQQNIVPGSTEVELSVDSSSTAIGTSFKETGEIQNIDLNETPSLKAPRRKKHRPKVIRENKPPRNRNQAKEKVGPDGTPVPKRKYVRKTPQEKIKDSATKPPLKSCRKSLHFDLEDNFGDTLNQVDLQKNIFQDVIAQEAELLNSAQQSNQSENNVNGYQILQEITVQQELQKTRQMIEEIQRRRVSQYIQSRASKRDYILASHGISTNTTNSQLFDQCYLGTQKRKRIENLSHTTNSSIQYSRQVQLNGYPVKHFVSDDSNPKPASGWIDLIRQPISSTACLGQEMMLAEKEGRISALDNVINPNLQNQMSHHANSRTQTQITVTTNNSNHAIVPMKKHKGASILCKPAAKKTGKHRKQKKTVSVDDITDQLKCLNLNTTNTQMLEDDQKALVPYKGDGTIVLYDDPLKRQKFWPKVDLDPETNRLWNLLMGKEASVNEQQTDEQKTKWWEEQRKVFRGRADSFIARMHLVQGDRRFSPWKGSVVDSVIGVFLTQNVTDHLSSSAFMSLAAQFPPQSLTRDTDLQKPVEVSIQSLDELVSSQDSTESSIVHINGSVQSLYTAGLTADCQTNSCQSISRYSTVSFIIEEMENNSRFPNFRSQDSGSLNYKTATDKNLQKKLDDTYPFDLNREAGDLVLSDTDGRHYMSLQSTAVSKDISDATTYYHLVDESSAQKSILTAEEPTLTESNLSKIKGKKAEGVKKSTVDWDCLRRQVKPEGEQKERSQNTMDSIDYEALHHAHVSKIAETIKPRGMNNMLAERIKEFLDRILKDHGSIDLEWLRDAPPDKAKDYLLSIKGLGLKSVECIRLLTLHQHAFPVDTNVGRIAVRLGWVPLQPLPESLQLHLLEKYPILESVQKYLYPRLCNLDQPTLYELHYQLITFGKVFCTKTKPNCNACPMRGECRHFASAFASSRLALPGPEEKSIVTTESPIETRRDATTNVSLLLLPSLQDTKPEETTLANRTCQPIVEEPSTPEPEISEIVDIEEAFYDDPDEIPTIRLNVEEFTQNLQIFMQDGDMSKALVAFDPQVASIPTQKLKNVGRLRTEHQVYQLPDSHPLLKELDKREPDDPSPYLLAIWTPGETANSIQPPEGICNSRESGQFCSETGCFTCNSVRESNTQTVRGTILIPCRTAMRGSFPLNGTYFQVNEVFADHESSLKPIDVPREWIWNLPRSTVYFGTSVSAIFRGMSTEEIQQCFWRGFVCVRGFDKQTRIPRPLMARLHFSASKQMREADKERKYRRQ